MKKSIKCLLLIAASLSCSNDMFAQIEVYIPNNDLEYCVGDPITVAAVSSPLPFICTLETDISVVVAGVEVLTVALTFNTLDSAFATFSSAAIGSTGSIQLVANELCLAPPTMTDTISITVHALPADPQINVVAGTTTFCDGGSVTLGTVGVHSSYQWFDNGSPVGTGSTVVVNSGGTHSITVTITDGNGCEATSAAQAVQVNALPVPVINVVAGSVNFCVGGSVTLGTVTGYSSYQWFDGGSPIGTLSTVVISSLGGHSITVTVTDANGCVGTSAAQAVQVNALPNPAITITQGTATFCAGNTVTLGTTTGFNGYQWFDGGSPVGTQSTLVVSSNGAHSITVEVTDANGCMATSAAQAIQVNALPTPVISIQTGSTTFCDGQSVTLGTTVGYTTYQWFDGGSPIGTQATVTISSVGPHSITVTVTDANGCENTSTAQAVQVNALPGPVITILQGTATFCDGSSVTLGTSTAYNSYQWFDGGSPIGTQATVVVNGLGTHPITVTVTDVNGCEATSAVQTVTGITLPEPAVTVVQGNATLCDGETVTLGTVNVFSSYQWFDDGTPAGTQSTLVVSSIGAHGITVTVTSGLNCVGASDPFAVVVNPLPVPSISIAQGSTSFCDGGSTTLETSQSFSAYQWFDGGTPIGTQPTVNVNSVGSHSITVIVTDANGCDGTSAAQSIVVNALPSPAITIAVGSAMMCDGESASLFTVDPYSLYQWFDGGSPFGTQPFVAVSALGSHTITVTVTDVNSCVGSSSVQSVVVNPLPTPQITILQGGATVCHGEDVSLGTTVSFSTYQWSDGANPVGTDLIEVVSAVGTHSMTVTVTDANTCEGTSATQSVVVNALPVPQIGVNQGNITLCEGESVTLETTSPFEAYQWADGATMLGTQPLETITAPGAHSITVTVTDANNCDGTSAAQTIEVNPQVTPTLSVFAHVGGIDTIGGGQSIQVCEGTEVEFVAGSPLNPLGYQWFDNGSPVGNDSTYMIGQADPSGTYSISCQLSFSTVYPVCVSASPLSTATVTVVSVPLIEAPTLIVTPQQDEICVISDLVAGTSGGSGGINASNGVEWKYLNDLIWSPVQPSLIANDTLSMRSVRADAAVDHACPTQIGDTITKIIKPGINTLITSVSELLFDSVLCSASPIAITALINNNDPLNIPHLIDWEVVINGAITTENDSVVFADNISSMFSYTPMDTGNYVIRIICNDTLLSDCNVDTGSVSFYVASVPDIPALTTDGPLCAGSEGVSITVDGALENLNYNWSSSEAELVSFAGNSGIVLNLPQSGPVTYSLLIENSFGCITELIDTLAVSATPAPAAANIVLIAQDWLVVQYNGADSLRWGYDEIPSLVPHPDYSANGVLQQYQDPLGFDFENRAYWVRIYEDGCFTRSHYGNLIGVQDHDEMVQLQLYPNPNSGIFRLLSQKPIESYRITDLSGRVVMVGKKLKGGRRTLDLDVRLSSGSYILQVVTSVGVNAVKFAVR